MDGETKLFPLWKQAVVDLVDLDPQPGHIVTEAWLIEHFDLPRPVGGDIVAQDKWRLTFLGYRANFKQALEDEHSLILTDKERDHDGMRLLAPNEVAAYEDQRWRARIGSETRRTVRRLKNTNMLQLTDAERAAHLDMLARRQWQAKLMRNTNRAAIPQEYKPLTLPRLRDDNGTEEP